MSAEDLLPGSQTVIFLLCPHRAEGVKELSGVSLIRALIPFMRAPPLRSNHSLKGPTSKDHHVGHQDSTYEFGGSTRAQILEGLWLWAPTPHPLLPSSPG